MPEVRLVVLLHLPGLDLLPVLGQVLVMLRPVLELLVEQAGLRSVPVQELAGELPVEQRLSAVPEPRLQPLRHSVQTEQVEPELSGLLVLPFAVQFVLMQKAELFELPLNMC